jgi:cytoskeletal protein CcmA (bactofilin family)
MLGNRKRFKVAKVDTLIGRGTVLNGDISFSGGLHVDGVIKGNVLSSDDPHAVLTVSEHGSIEGEVRVPNIILNGAVSGDVYALERIELAVQACVSGNVYYNLLEMAMGAEVNGSLLHNTEASMAREQQDEVFPVQDEGLSLAK